MDFTLILALSLGFLTLGDILAYSYLNNKIHQLEEDLEGAKHKHNNLVYLVMCHLVDTDMHLED